MSTDYLVNIALELLYGNAHLYPLSPGFEMRKLTLKTVIAGTKAMSLSTADVNCLRLSASQFAYFHDENCNHEATDSHFICDTTFHLSMYLLNRLKCSVEQRQYRANKHIINAWSKVAGSQSYNETLVTMKTHFIKLRKRDRN